VGDYLPIANCLGNGDLGAGRGTAAGFEPSNPVGFVGGRVGRDGNIAIDWVSSIRRQPKPQVRSPIPNFY
jgi:hypothetical protein